jgi:DNA-binding transcriptional regulator GbsR (MarR family)
VWIYSLPEHVRQLLRLLDERFSAPPLRDLVVLLSKPANLAPAAATTEKVAAAFRDAISEANRASGKTTLDNEYSVADVLTVIHTTPEMTLAEVAAALGTHPARLAKALVPVHNWGLVDRMAEGRTWYYVPRSAAARAAHRPRRAARRDSARRPCPDGRAVRVLTSLLDAAATETTTTEPASSGRASRDHGSMLHVLATIEARPCLTASELTRAVGLSRPMVWRRLRQLHELGLVRVSPSQPASGSSPTRAAGGSARRSGLTYPAAA